MDWRLVSMAPLFMWALYLVFASLASNAHGEKVTMAVEALAMMVVAGGVLVFSGVSEFRRATPLSLTFAGIMGMMSALGVLVQFYAFRIAPPDQQGVVGMLGGMYPILGVVIFYGMAKFGLAGGSVLSLRQWLGVACGALALWLISK